VDKAGTSNAAGNIPPKPPPWIASASKNRRSGSAAKNPRSRIVSQPRRVLVMALVWRRGGPGVEQSPEFRAGI
jgi:hypothetical protein